MIHLAPLEDFFDHEEETIQNFIAIVLMDWQMIKSDLLIALQERNLANFRFHAHRMNSIMRMLQAHRLEQSILTLKMHLMENPTEDFTKKQEEVFAAMQEITNVLQRRMQ